MSTPSDTPVLWPFVIYGLAVLVVVGGMMVLSYLLGERHREEATGEPFESGILTTGQARLRLSAHFYLIAMFFVIFDLEAVFIVAWAVGILELGWAGYIEIMIFIGVLLAALIYLWRIGALDYGPNTFGIRRSGIKREKIEE